MESYLYKVSNYKYRQAITRLRISSHDLMIEKGRHILIDNKDRLCPICRNINTIEDEIHFLVSFPLNSEERDTFYREIELDRNIIDAVSPVEIFRILKNFNDQRHL